MLLMRKTTVDSVTEQHDFFQKIDKSSYYKPYSISTTLSTRPNILTVPLLHSTTTKTYETQQPTRTEHLTKNATSLNENSYYALNSIATSLLTPRYALTISSSLITSTKTCGTHERIRTEHLPERNSLPSTKTQQLRTAFNRYALIPPTIRSCLH